MDKISKLLMGDYPPKPQPDALGNLMGLGQRAGGALPIPPTPAPIFAPTPKRVWGYDVRDPYASENTYFQSNPHVTGMAAEDGRITLNPHSKISPQEMEAVARNEAARLFMRENNFQFDWDPTPEQTKSFAGTAYANDPQNMRATILARAISGDPSAGQLTPQQQEWVNWLRPQLEKRR